MMKNIVLVIVLFYCGVISAQWLTLPNAQTGFIRPKDDFKINPYTNELWGARYQEGMVRLSVNGTVTHYSEATLGNQFWIYGDIKIGFTSNNVYYSREQDGLYNLNNGSQNLIFGLQDIKNLSNDADTLFIQPLPGYCRTLTEPNLPIQQSYGSIVNSKNGNTYFNVGALRYVLNNGSFMTFDTDPLYYQGSVYSFNFKKQTDSLYIGFENGLSVCYKDQCYDTITPYNTINMPSGKIAEIEFDKDDNLWCAFADFSPTPQIDSYHAIAKLEGNTWQVYNTSNTPFNWDAYYGMEIDTLGNVWVATGNNLHVLQSNSNPAWLSIPEFEKETITIYPNPATNLIMIEDNENITAIELTALSGKTVATYKINNTKKININTASFPKGVYLIKVSSAKGVVIKKIILH